MGTVRAEELGVLTVHTSARLAHQGSRRMGRLLGTSSLLSFGDAMVTSLAAPRKPHHPVGRRCYCRTHVIG